MKYCFTTLAAGEKYENIATKLFQDLREKTSDCDFFIATNNKELTDLGERIYVDCIEGPVRAPNTLFLYNLKSLAFKHVVKHEQLFGRQYDYIIYIDADWYVDEGFNENKILDLLNYMEEEDIDFSFERNAFVRQSRIYDNVKEAFFLEKLIEYDVMDYEGWDEARVPNEQFMIFKNSTKFKVFVMKWEMFLLYSMKYEINNHAEGFEMGVSAYEVGMSKYNFNLFYRFLEGCFYFFNSSGVKHTKF